MNIEEANAIPMSAILSQIKCALAKSSTYDQMYFSPFRREKTPSFHVNVLKNVWYDFGAAKGGTVIDLVCAYLEAQEEDHTPADALRWVNNMFRTPATMISFPFAETKDPAPVLVLKQVGRLKDRKLLNYFESRGIPTLLAQKYLSEVYVRNRNTSSNFYAAGLENVDGGFELLNKAFKGSIAPKSISLVRGDEPVPDTVHIFEGIMDFLTAALYQPNNRLKGDVIILNSVACVPQALPYLANYSYKTVCLWLDNDAAGRSATQALAEFIRKQPNMSCKTMNRLYQSHKDLNKWHMTKLGL